MVIVEDLVSLVPVAGMGYCCVAVPSMRIVKRAAQGEKSGSTFRSKGVTSRLFRGDFFKGDFSKMIVEADLELIEDARTPENVETHTKTLREPYRCS